MPRKPQPPMDFIIESISTGERVYSVDKSDDFSGQPIERKLAPRAGAIPTAEEIKLKRKQREAVHVQRRQLQAQQSAKALVKVITDMIDPPKHRPFRRRL